MSGVCAFQTWNAHRHIVMSPHGGTHKEEVHSKCIPPFWQTGTTACVLFYFSNTTQLVLYVDQQSTI